MKRFLHNLVENIWPQLALFGMVFILFVTNYLPGTYLTGWDNLHPEFNFAVNVKRSIFMVWQEYQGLGLLGGMGHASDIAHQILLLPFSWILPDSFLRYLWTFLMLFAGSLGVYFLVKKLVFQDTGKLWPLLGALFYLLNLATIQTFYAPFEAFIAHFSSLPWLLLISLLYFKNPSKRHLALLVIILFLSTPAAYIPTLFLVYILSLLILLVSIMVVKILRKKGGVKILLTRSLNVFATVLIINAFWLLPFSYFALTNSQVALTAQINLMSSGDIFLRNKEFGDILDVALLKGFWFNNVDPDFDRNPAYMLQPWREHLGNPLVLLAGYTLFATVVIGFVKAIRAKSSTPVAFGILFLFALTVLTTNTPPFSWVDALFRKAPLFDQAFRFTFTKFSILAALTYSIFFALGTKTISEACSRKLELAEWLQVKSKIRTALPVFFASFSLLVFLALPAFQGNLFYQKERIRIPNEYLQLFEFFRNQDPNTRVANFPQHTFWGWTLYDWGYGGSGFLWYGIEQPILDRAFDVWNSKNENYYWEISYALYSQNQELFEKVLEKYGVSWILVDKNVINPSSPKALYLNELEQMLTSSKFNLAQTFGNIQIYKVNLETPGKDFVFLAQNLPSIGPIYNWNNLDTAYLENGNYLSSPTTNYSLPTTIYYPFRSLFTGREQKDLEFQVEELPTSFVVKSRIPAHLKNYRVEIPKYSAQDLLAFPQRAYKKDGYLYIHIPKLADNLARKIDPTKLELPPCAKSKGEVVELTSRGGATCNMSIPLETLPHNVSYLISAKNQNVKGKPIVFWFENLNSRKADIEINLPKTKSLTQSFFVQPPIDPFGQGYTLHFENISIGKEEVINIFGEIEIQPLPFDFLRSIKLVLLDSVATSTLLTTPRKVVHPNPAFYEVALGEVSPSTTLVLSQSFDKGWKSFTLDSKFQFLNSLYLAPLFGREIKEHVLVNNWANGWQLDESQAGKTIVIVYLPQYLEFFGFFLLFGFGIFLVPWRRKTTLPLQ